MKYQPAWMTEELHQKLRAISGGNQRKKHDTVLRLAEARATGGTDAAVYKMPECCSRTCWEGKYKDGVKQTGWRDDPAIAAALKVATERALWWQANAEGRRIAKRQEYLAEARDKLAEYSPKAVGRLFILMSQAGNEETRRKAANDILDRADEATAAKSVVEQTGEHERTHKFDLSDVPTELLELIVSRGPGDGQDPGEGREGGTE